MSDDEVVASDVPPRYLFLLWFNFVYNLLPPQSSNTESTAPPRRLIKLPLFINTNAQAEGGKIDDDPQRIDQ